MIKKTEAFTEHGKAEEGVFWLFCKASKAELYSYLKPKHYIYMQ